MLSIGLPGVTELTKDKRDPGDKVMVVRTPGNSGKP